MQREVEWAIMTRAVDRSELLLAPELGVRVPVVGGDFAVAAAK